MKPHREKAIYLSRGGEGREDLNCGNPDHCVPGAIEAP